MKYLKKINGKWNKVENEVRKIFKRCEQNGKWNEIENETLKNTKYLNQNGK